MINQQPSRSGSPTSPRPPSPSQTYHPSILPLAVPTPALLESLAGAAHYSSVNVEPDSVALRHRYSSEFHRRHSSPTPVSADHEGVMEDLKELYCCAPTTENLDQRWRKDAIFEVGLRFSYCRCHPLNILCRIRGQGVRGLMNMLRG